MKVVLTVRVDARAGDGVLEQAGFAFLESNAPRMFARNTDLLQQTIVQLSEDAYADAEKWLKEHEPAPPAEEKLPDEDVPHKPLVEQGEAESVGLG